MRRTPSILLNLQGLLVVFAVTAVMAWPLNAEAASARCEVAELDDLACLLEEYDQADQLLKQKLKNLLVRAQKFDPGEYSTEEKQRIRKDVVNAISGADRAWRTALKNECETLLTVSFGHGAGAAVAIARCKIQRTYDRIAFLSKDETYKWIE
nr:lysozyme inhibitor LprI family protein [uncultured Roseateles sp.]